MNTTDDRKSHWEAIYTNKDHREVSWYQESPTVSLQLLNKTGVSRDDAIIDIGAGASCLIDALIEKGYRDVSILDISKKALAIVKQRLADKALIPAYYVADITEFSPGRQFDVWHDRAVFHFLTRQEDRARYVERLDAALSSKGRVIIGTFSLNGPRQCSGLDIEQYDTDKIHAVLGERFELLDTHIDEHTTPGGAQQEFIYFVFQRAER